MSLSGGTVYFAGVGSGDPELLTIKALKLICAADCIIYAGSLVNPIILENAKDGAALHNSANLKLEEQIKIMQNAFVKNEVIARLHTGDPSIYSSISEEIQALETLHIPWEIIPGVTAAFSVAAELGIEYTLPELTQSLIITRLSGRTPMPEAEDLASLAAHHCSMAIYLSTGMISRVIQKLSAAGYEQDTPIAVVYRSGWPDQKIIRGTLEQIEKLLEKAEITHQALIILSPALSKQNIEPSHLYGTFQDRDAVKKPGAIITLSQSSLRIGMEVKKVKPEFDLFVSEKNAGQCQGEFTTYSYGLRQLLQEAFVKYDALICIMASGIVIRELAPMLHNKHTDPAVIVMDNNAEFVISLLSGHLGGANTLARELASALHAAPVITTASDTQNIPPLDIYIAEKRMKADRSDKLTAVMSAFVNAQAVACLSDFPVSDDSPLREMPLKFYEAPYAVDPSIRHRIFFSDRILRDDEKTNCTCLQVFSRGLILGVGCNKSTSMEEIESVIQSALTENGLSLKAVETIATVPEKEKEPGILAVANKYGWDLVIIQHELIDQLDIEIKESPYAKKYLGIKGVAEPCALIASHSNKLTFEKFKSGNVTVAGATREIIL